jgi:hypothetical protein
MFGDANQEQLVTLTQREDMACALGKDLSRFLLERHVSSDTAAQPKPDRVCCPKCGRTARKITKTDTSRPVTTLAGDIDLHASNGAARVAESFFFPLDEKLQLGTEGYSPQVLKRAVRQASKAPSFAEASDDLRELADISISPAHLERLSERIGSEWAQQRDQDVAAFRARQLRSAVVQTAPVATVMLDGGRVQIRADESPRGVHNPEWHETKVACCMSLSSQAHAVDPQPDPPSKLLDPPKVIRLAAELSMKGCSGAAAKHGRSARSGKKQHKMRRKHRRVKTKRVRTVVATTLDSDSFGWQVAAEVQRRDLNQAQRKACVCDGQRYNWSIFELHLLPLGFVPILDFLHLIVYLYAASHAVLKKGSVAAWKQYERWVRWAWSGQVDRVAETTVTELELAAVPDFFQHLREQAIARTVERNRRATCTPQRESNRGT